ncbi:MAG: hypothetical protein AB1689_24385, partial [Thermodesulfobacteriota bacterium]
RLAAITDKGRLVLEAAAVIGREFEASILSSAVDLPFLDVLKLLDEPRRHGLVTEGPAERFAFRHALIREALYDDLPADRRLQIHDAVGKALEARAQVDPDRYCAQVAHHLLAAAPLNRGDAFVEHATRAAHRAMSRMAFEEAVTLHQKTLAVIGYASQNDRRHCEILLSLGRAQEWAGEADASRETFKRAAEIARRIGAVDLLTQAALGVGAVVALKFVASSRSEAAPELLREALAATSSDDTISRGRLLSRLALHGCSDTASTEAVELSADAVRAARMSGDATTLVHALTARHGVLLEADDLAERLSIAREVLAIATAVGSPEFAMRGHALMITDLVDAGDMNAVDEAIAAHAQLSDETKDPFERWASLVWRSMRNMMAGRLDAAEYLAHQAHEFATRVAGPYAREIYAALSFTGQKLAIDDIRGQIPSDFGILYELRDRYPESLTLRTVPAYFAAHAGRTEDVRRELMMLRSNGFRDLKRNVTWLCGVWLLARPIHFTSDRQSAEALYPLLLPYQDRNVTISVVACFGSAHHALGLLAATLDRWDDAARHFEAALAMNARMGARPYVAMTSYDYARLMPLAAGPRARQRAVALAEEALRLAREIGMRRLEREAGELSRRLRDDSITIDTPQQQPDDAPRLVKDGDVWVLSHRGERTLLKDAKGLHYVAELLRQAGREVHVLDLLALTEPLADEEAPVGTAASARSMYEEELLDARARRAYRRRLGELTRDLETASAGHDPEQAACARQEIMVLRRELTRAVGLGQRPRRSSDTERARINVTRTIRLALARIVEAAPDLGTHLARSIRTGIFCCYLPDAEGDPETVTAKSLSAESTPAHAPHP